MSSAFNRRHLVGIEGLSAEELKAIPWIVPLRMLFTVPPTEFVNAMTPLREIWNAGAYAPSFYSAGEFLRNGKSFDLNSCDLW